MLLILVFKKKNLICFLQRYMLSHAVFRK